MPPEILPVIIASSIVLVGSIINAVVLLKTNKRAKESEERRHYRELIIRSAIETWKQVNERTAKADTVNPYPLEAHIIRMVKFSELFIDQKFDASTLDQKLSEMNIATGMFIAHSEKQKL